MFRVTVLTDTFLLLTTTVLTLNDILRRQQHRHRMTRHLRNRVIHSDHLDGCLHMLNSGELDRHSMDASGRALTLLTHLN